VCVCVIVCTCVRVCARLATEGRRDPCILVPLHPFLFRVAGFMPCCVTTTTPPPPQPTQPQSRHTQPCTCFVSSGQSDAGCWAPWAPPLSMTCHLSLLCASVIVYCTVVVLIKLVWWGCRGKNGVKKVYNIK